MVDTRILDCDEGRARGCATFCCRLLVRLGPEERDPSGDAPGKSLVDKNPRTGLCLLLDPTTQRCTAWDRRPKTCREYDCREDPRLAIVLEHGFVGLVELARRAAEHERRARR